VSGGITSKGGVAIADNYQDGATFEFGPIDKLDVIAYNGDVLVQYLTGTAWQPPQGQLVRAGIGRSLPGLSLVYPPGPTGVRFKLNTAGTPNVTVDFDAFAVA
jgi:hypothetical protein